jgi:hypothetical protein
MRWGLLFSRQGGIGFQALSDQRVQLQSGARPRAGGHQALGERIGRQHQRDRLGHATRLGLGDAPVVAAPDGHDGEGRHDGRAQRLHGDAAQLLRLLGRLGRLSRLSRLGLGVGAQQLGLRLAQRLYADRIGFHQRRARRIGDQRARSRKGGPSSGGGVGGSSGAGWGGGSGWRGSSRPRSSRWRPTRPFRARSW